MTGSSILSRSNDPVPVETRLQLVLAVLAHEMTVAEAARRHGVSAESINRWRNRFVDAGKAAMEDGMPGKAGSRGSLVEGRQRAEIQELSSRWPRRQCSSDLAEGLGARRPGPFADLEALRAAAGLPVSRFADWLVFRNGPTAAGWPAPRRRRQSRGRGRRRALMRSRRWRRSMRAWPARRHRKIAAMMRADGHQASTSTVQRALRRRGLLLPRGYRADRKSWAVPSPGVPGSAD